MWLFRLGTLGDIALNTYWNLEDFETGPTMPLSFFITTLPAGFWILMLIVHDLRLQTGPLDYSHLVYPDGHMGIVRNPGTLLFASQTNAKCYGMPERVFPHNLFWFHTKPHFHTFWISPSMDCFYIRFDLLTGGPSREECRAREMATEFGFPCRSTICSSGVVLIYLCLM